MIDYRAEWEMDAKDERDSIAKPMTKRAKQKAKHKDRQAGDYVYPIEPCRCTKKPRSRCTWAMHAVGGDHDEHVLEWICFIGATRRRDMARRFLALVGGLALVP